MPTRRERLTSLVDRALERAVRPVDGAPAVLTTAMRYCLFSGGKRFRPLLCVGGCEAVGGTPQQALTVACAIELVHTYSLVHDDLPAMDNADERRGRPSCHRKFGEATAILVGDALLTRAFELLSSNGTRHVVEIIRTIGRAGGTAGLIGGQLLDLAADRATRASAPRLEEIATRKTAALITASVVSGGLAGGGAPAALARLRRFGRHLGLAFQLIDDLHDQENLAEALGSRRAKEKAHTLIRRARQELRLFGSRAEVLHELATWLQALSEQTSQ